MRRYIGGLSASRSAGSNLRRSIAGLAAVFIAVPLTAAIVPIAAAYTAAEGLADLNAWRSAAGEREVASFRPDWNEGCRLHNEYESLNGELTHEEQPDHPGYTTAGDDAGRQSVLAGGEKLPREAWSDTVYHREQVLAPRLHVSGYAASSGFTCLRTIGGEFDSSQAGRAPGFTAYPWPPNGGTEVPLAFSSGETPNPYEVTPGVDRLGYLLSVDFDGPWEMESPFAQSQISSASLVSDAGAAVPIAIDDAVTGFSRGFGSPFGLFPEGPLDPCTWYTAAATGTAYPSGTLATAYPIDISWRFETTCSSEAGAAEAGEPAKRQPRISFAHLRVRGHRLRARLLLTPPGYPFAGVALLARRGTTQRRLRVSSGLRVNVRLGSGRWRLLARAAEIQAGRRVWSVRRARRVRVR